MGENNQRFLTSDDIPEDAEICVFRYPQITPEQSKNYVAEGGGKCPLCGSEHIEGTRGPEIDGSTAWQKIRCLSCNAVWHDVYELVAADNEFTRDA